MATQDISIKRGGKVHNSEIGTTAEAGTRLSITDADLDETHQQGIRKAPIRLIIDFDEGELNGGVVSMQTIWKQAMISNGGKPIHATGVNQYMTTNQADIAAFVAMFGGPILMSMLNGYVRDVMGFNDKPVFNTQTRAIIQYTPEQEAAAPTNDYHAQPEPIDADPNTTGV